MPVAMVSTFRDGKQFWTELELYDHGDEWELVVIGATSIAKKWENTKSRVCETEEEVIEALRDPESGSLSGPALDLLRAAGIDTGGTHADTGRGD